jgi:hypothetical protein
MKHRAFLLIAFLALLVSCRTEVFYENYDESGYKEDGLTKAEFIEDFRMCEKHKKRLRKALIPIKYGYAPGVTKVPDTIPNAYNWPQVGGSGSTGPAIPRFAAVVKCATCQKEFRIYKLKLKKT